VTLILKNAVKIAPWLLIEVAALARQLAEKVDDRTSISFERSGQSFTRFSFRGGSLSLRIERPEIVMEPVFADASSVCFVIPLLALEQHLESDANGGDELIDVGSIDGCYLKEIRKRA